MNIYLRNLRKTSFNTFTAAVSLQLVLLLIYLAWPSNYWLSRQLQLLLLSLVILYIFTYWQKYRITMVFIFILLPTAIDISFIFLVRMSSWQMLLLALFSSSVFFHGRVLKYQKNTRYYYYYYAQNLEIFRWIDLLYI